MILRLLALVIATPLVALSAPVAMAQPATGATVLPLTASPPVPRIVVDAPLAEPLPHRRSAGRPGVRPEGAQDVARHRAPPRGA